MSTGSDHRSVQQPAAPVASGDRVEMAALSHPGHARPNNEDVYIVLQADRALRKLESNLPKDALPEVNAEICYGLLVADGVGGMAAGEVASRMAVTTLIHLALDTPDWVMLPGQAEGRRILDRMTERFRLVDAVLRAEAGRKPELAGMATTMTAAVIVGRELLVGHVGDSRAYLCRGDKFDQLTRDHTTVQDFTDAGFIQPGEARSLPYRHALTRALGGTHNQSHPDLHRLTLRDNDQVLLCTDGLSDQVDPAAIASMLRAAATAKDACQALVDLALKHGGQDNVTVGVARCHFTPDEVGGTRT
jgi:serine/threonine protein phosphatase PrpC